MKIKLADRIHNVRSLQLIVNIKPEKVKRYIKETLEIYIPKARQIDLKIYKILKEALNEINQIVYGKDIEKPNPKFIMKKELVRNRGSFNEYDFEKVLQYLSVGLESIKVVYNEEEVHTIIGNMINGFSDRDFYWTLRMIRKVLTELKKDYYETYYEDYEEILKGEGYIPKNDEELILALIERA